MTNERDYPSVELAYEIAIQSYDGIAKRVDALDGKVQTLMAVMVTASLAVPVIFKTFELQPKQSLLLLAMSIFAVSLIVGTYCRTHGRLRVLSPQVLYDEWISKAPDAFKADMVFFAGEHFDTNVELLEYKHRLLVITVSLYAFAVVSLVAAVLVG